MDKLKKTTIKILIITLLLISCNSKKIDGVWMSYGDRVKNLESGWSTGNVSGYIIDFDNFTFGRVPIDSVAKVNFNFNKNTFNFTSDSINIDFKIYGKDSIEIELYNNTISVFRPLNLNYKLNITKNEINKFLINSELPHAEKFKMFDSENNFIDYLKLDFKNDFNKLDETKKTRILKSNRMLFSSDGDWFVGEINKNFFLFFSGDQAFERNIYQIISIDKSTMKLKPLFETEDMNGITELKTIVKLSASPRPLSKNIE